LNGKIVKARAKQRVFLIIFYSSKTILPPQLNKKDEFKLMLALFFREGQAKKNDPTFLKKNDPTFLPKMGFKSLRGVS
jgi:hypothetical protein